MAVAIEKAAWQLGRLMLHATPADRALVSRIVLGNGTTNQPAPPKTPAPRGARKSTKKRPPRAEITKWTAGPKERRVPNFVIEATGLDTKKKIVAKFGEGATFEKDKPLPAELRVSKESLKGNKGAKARVEQAAATA